MIVYQRRGACADNVVALSLPDLAACYTDHRDEPDGQTAKCGEGSRKPRDPIPGEENARSKSAEGSDRARVSRRRVFDYSIEGVRCMTERERDFLNKSLGAHGSRDSLFL